MKSTTGVDWELMFAVNLKQTFIFIPSQMYKTLDQAYKFDNLKKPSILRANIKYPKK